MNQIPTAEEFWIKWPSNRPTSECLIEFAKLHVDKQREQVLDALPNTLDVEVYKIARHTYPLTNIK
jgi:hypothetical protein